MHVVLPTLDSAGLFSDTLHLRKGTVLQRPDPGHVCKGLGIAQRHRMLAGSPAQRRSSDDDHVSRSTRGQDVRQGICFALIDCQLVLPANGDDASGEPTSVEAWQPVASIPRALFVPIHRRRRQREVETGISDLLAPDGTFIHPRAAERTKFCSAYNRPAPEAVTSAHADVEPTGAAAFRAHSAARQPAALTSLQQRLVKTGGRLVKHADTTGSCWRKVI